MAASCYAGHPVRITGSSTDTETLTVENSSSTLERPTVALRVRARTRTTRGVSGSAPPAGFHDNADVAAVLWAEEVHRWRITWLFGAVIGLGTMATLFFLSGAPSVRLTLQASCAATALCGGVIAWILSQPNNAACWPVVRLGCYLVPLLLIAPHLYAGLGSPANMLISGFTFVLGLSSQRMYGPLALTCATHWLLATLMLTGAITEQSMMRLATSASLIDSFWHIMFVQAVALGTFILGRRMRNSHVEALARQIQLARDLARRDALLQEARMDLEQALEQRGIGRYSDLTVGSFKLGMLIGRGGMGEVYRGTHVVTGEEAAIKLLLPQALGDGQMVKRFLREVEIAASLSSPHIVRVLEIPKEDAPIKYLAMEYLRGDSLAALLRHEPVLPISEVLPMVREVGAGIHAAHQAGIVHRDLKPLNIFRHQETQNRAIWKILDFGVSKLCSHDGTLTGSRVVGTPGYMAPEQANGRDVDHRADLFSLGVSIYRAVTGRPAFTGANAAAVLYAVIHDMPVRPSLYLGVPRSLDYVLAVALAKSPAARFEDALAMVHAVEEAMAGRIDKSLRMRALRLLAEHPWRKD